MVFYPSTVGLFHEFVGAHCSCSLRLREKTFLEWLASGSVASRYSQRSGARGVDGGASEKSHVMAAALNIEPRKQINKPGSRPCGPKALFSDLPWEAAEGGCE